MCQTRSYRLSKLFFEVESDMMRFRFLVPSIDTPLTYLKLAIDFHTVCDEQVKQTLITNALASSKMVLSMSAMDILFLKIGRTFCNLLKLLDLKMVPVSEKNSDVSKNFVTRNLPNLFTDATVSVPSNKRFCRPLIGRFS